MNILSSLEISIVQGGTNNICRQPEPPNCQPEMEPSPCVRPTSNNSSTFDIINGNIVISLNGETQIYPSGMLGEFHAL